MGLRLLAGLAVACALLTAAGGASAAADAHMYTGTIPNTGCGWSLAIQVSDDTVDLKLNDQPNCLSVHLNAELTGRFDGANTGPKGTGTDVTFDTVASVSATVLGQQISSIPDQSFETSIDVGVDLQQAAQAATSAQQAVQGASQNLAGKAALYLSHFVLDQAEGAGTQLDFDKPLEALTSAQETFCSNLALAGTFIPNQPAAPTYVNCDPPTCPAGSTGNACASGSVNADTAALSGSGGASQDQLCPATPPQPDYLFVCVPTYVTGDYDAGSQALVVLPGGALVATPVGSSLTNLLAGPTLSSKTAILLLGGLIAGDNLTLKAPAIEMAAGAAELLGNLSLQGSKQVSIGSIDLSSLKGLSSDLSSALGALQPWLNLAASAGINDAKVTSQLSSASIALPMEVTGQAITVTTPGFTLGAGSKLDTQGLGGSNGRPQFFGQSHGGYGGIPGTLGDTWDYWHLESGRSATYDSPFAPSKRGAGDASLPGGGIVRIDAHGGKAEIDGTVDVDGFWEPDDPTYLYQCNNDDGCGFGAGGSVFITAATFAGNGVVSADGASICQYELPCDGRLYDGAGGGGRVAVLYGSDASWSGSLQAYGGWDRLIHADVSSAYPDGTGGAGTVFTRQVKFASSGAVSSGEGTFPGGTLTVDDGQTKGWYPPPEYYAPADATPVLDVWSSPSRKLVVAGGALVWATNPHFGEIDVLGGSTLTTPLEQTKLHLSAKVLNVDKTSRVTVDARGFGYDGTGDDKGASAPGSTRSKLGAGGSHGGAGGVNSEGNLKSGSTYDSTKNPHLPGAGGSGAGNNVAKSPNDVTGYDGEPGGGVLDLKVGTLQLDGVLSADGADSAGPTATEQAVYSHGDGSGAGAGGSLVLHVAKLSGSGSISATGGIACERGGPPQQPKQRAPGSGGCGGGGPGGGGGGRVAVYAGAACSWTGAVDVAGGIDQLVADHHDAMSNGKPGSVYFPKATGTC